MPAIKNNTIEVRFRTSQEIRSRLEHHAKRLGTDMNDIVRQGTVDYLDRLDDLEAIAIERRKNKPKALVPEHKWGSVPGLGKNKPAEKISFKLPTLSFLQKKEEVKVPDKVKSAFRRWAEYIEDAEDRSDAERRAQVVLEDMREKCANDSEIDASCTAFKEFTKERQEAMTKQDEVVDVGDITIDGDV